MRSSFSPEARLAFLWQASHALSSSLDYESTLRTVARLLVPTLADWCAVDLADGTGRLERLAIVHVDPERERWGWEVHRRYPSDPEGPGPARVFHSGEPLLLAEVPDDLLARSARDAEHLRLLRELGLSSLLIVPLSARDRRLGVITLATAESTRRYGPEEQALAQELGGRAGLAVENARLYLAEQRARATAEAAAERSARLLTLSSALARDHTAADVAATSLRHARTALGAPAGIFYLVPPDGAALELLHQEGYPDAVLERWRQVPPDLEIPLAEAARGVTVFVETRHDLATRYRGLAEVRTWAGAMAMLPLVSHGRTIGVLGVSFPTERTFSPDDREFVLILAGHCAQALDRALATTALQESEARFRSVVESGMLGIAFWDGQRVTEANDELLELLGYDRADLAAGTLRHGALTPPEFEPADARAYAECLERGICSPYEKEFFRKDGSRVPVLVGGSLLPGTGTYGVFFVLDLTRRRRAEAQAQAAQRMEAVGRLAGGVAHEINNALQGVVGFASFVRRSLPPDDPRARDVAEIQKAATRAADITQQLLAFSRRQVRRPQLLDLDRIAVEFVPILQQALGPERLLTLVPPTQPVVVHADRGQIEQVLLNLTLNARDAMPTGGRLTLAVYRVPVGPHVLAAAQSKDEVEHPAPGEYVCLEVRDTGSGMPPEVRERIFEPFFTTKPPGKGTGLGLSVVYGIVRQSGGFVTVDSAHGTGSTFRVHLPAVRRAAEQTAEPPPPPPPGGSETVLVVDDEPSVRAVAERTLLDAGYRVYTASNGEEALAVLDRQPGIALVLSDLLMPVLGGKELARRIAQHRPGVRLLLFSGDPESAIEAGDGERRSGQMLFKPFAPEDLLRAVRRALDAGKARAEGA